MNASRTSASTWKKLMYHVAAATVAPRLSADDSTDDASSLSPDVSIRPGGGVLGVPEAKVMVSIDPTF